MPFLINCFLSIFDFVATMNGISQFPFLDNYCYPAIWVHSYTFPNYARIEMNQRNINHITKGQKMKKAKNY